MAALRLRDSILTSAETEGLTYQAYWLSTTLALGAFLKARVLPYPTLPSPGSGSPRGRPCCPGCCCTVADPAPPQDCQALACLPQCLLAPCSRAVQASRAGAGRLHSWALRCAASAAAACTGVHAWRAALADSIWSLHKRRTLGSQLGAARRACPCRARGIVLTLFLNVSAWARV